MAKEWQKVGESDQPSEPSGERSPDLGGEWQTSANQPTDPGNSAPAEPWYEDFAEGVGVSGLETYYGIKDLAGMMDDEDKATLKDWKDDAGQSGWGTGGQVVGELAQFIVPGGAAIKGAKALSKAKNLSKIASGGAILGADVFGNASLAGARLPEEGQTRLGNMKDDALMTIAGSGLGKLLGLSKPLMGFNKTDAAEELIEKGGRPFVGQAASNPLQQVVAGLSEYFPILGPMANKARKRGELDWNNLSLKETVPPKFRDAVTETGEAGQEQVRKIYDKQYDKAFSAGHNVSGQFLEDAMTAIRTARHGVSRQGSEAIDTLVQEFKDIAIGRKKHGIPPGPDDFRKIEDAFMNANKKAALLAEQGDPKLMREISRLKSQWRDTLPKESRDILNELDQYWPGRVASRDAAQQTQRAGGLYSPTELRSKSKIGASANAAAEGKDSLADIAKLGREVLDRKSPPEIFNYIRQIMANNTDIPLMDVLGNLANDVATGSTKAQKGAKKIGLDEILKMSVMAPHLLRSDET